MTTTKTCRGDSDVVRLRARNIVSSGNDIIITTPDPEHPPLPDEDLLWMQWTLHRLAALCVTAGFRADLSFVDDDFAEY